MYKFVHVAHAYTGTACMTMVEPTPFAAALFPPGSFSRSELVIHYAELDYSTSEIRAFLTEIHGVNIRYGSLVI